MKHSPTPWKTHPDPIFSDGILDAENNPVVERCHMDNVCDPHFIVHAANCHDELVAALEMIAGQRPCIDNLMGDKDIARAALAKAKAKAKEVPK